MSHCAKCGHDLSETQSFCTQCGTKNEAAQSIEKREVESLRSQPNEIADKPTANIHQTKSESSALITIWRSKIFWIVIAIVFLISLSYKLGYKAAQPWDNSPAAQADSIAQCEKWGGKAVYDRNGNYSDCAINGRLGGE